MSMKNDGKTSTANIYLCFHLFQVISCPALVESTGTTLSPRECLVVDGRNVNDTCNVSCQDGYQLSDPNVDTLICLETGSWDPAIIACERE